MVGVPESESESDSTPEPLDRTTGVRPRLRSYYAPAVHGDRRRGARGGARAALIGLTLGWCCLASGAFAQEAPPSTFPGQQGQPEQPQAQQPQTQQPQAQPQWQQPQQQWQQPQQQQQQQQPAARPQQPAEPRQPRLAADEHTCETLFEGEEDEGLEENEECFRDPDVRWRWQLAFFTGPTRTDDWDDSLAARGYGPSDVLFGGETSLIRRLGSYVGLGARTSVRDLRWLHFERPPAAVFGWDLLLAGELRFAIGRKELAALGVDAGVGLGLAFSRVNEGRATDVGWRLQAGAVLALRIMGPAAAIVRLGYDHFPVTIGDSLDAQLGGFRVSLGVEIRE